MKLRDSVEWGCHFIFVFQDTAEYSKYKWQMPCFISGEQVAFEAGELKGCRMFRKSKTTTEEWKLRE